MIIISALIAFIVAIFRFALPIKESKLREKILLLQNRIAELKKGQTIELAQEANLLTKELTEIESKLRGYPSLIALLSFLTIITTGIAVIMIFSNY